MKKVSGEQENAISYFFFCSLEWTSHCSLNQVATALMEAWGRAWRRAPICGMLGCRDLFAAFRRCTKPAASSSWRDSPIKLQRKPFQHPNEDTSMNRKNREKERYS